MKFFAPSLAFLVLLLAEPVLAQAAPPPAVVADNLPPTLTWTLPATGTAVSSKRITASGTVIDTVQGATTGTKPTTATLAGVDVVEYRKSGEKKWHTAILIPGTTSGTTTTGTTTTGGTNTADTWVFTIKLSKGNSVNVSIRARDKQGNESDTITRRIYRARSSSVN